MEPLSSGIVSFTMPLACKSSANDICIFEALALHRLHIIFNLQPGVPLIINAEKRESVATEFVDVTNPVSSLNAGSCPT